MPGRVSAEGVPSSHTPEEAPTVEAFLAASLRSVCLESRVENASIGAPTMVDSRGVASTGLCYYVVEGVSVDLLVAAR